MKTEFLGFVLLFHNTPGAVMEEMPVMYTGNLNCGSFSEELSHPIVLIECFLASPRSISHRFFSLVLLKVPSLRVPSPHSHSLCIKYV